MNTSTNKLLAFVVVLQVMILGSLWTANTLPVAKAQLPDPGAQRERQLDELKDLNKKMDQLIDLLGSGKVQVTVAGSDKK